MGSFQQVMSPEVTGIAGVTKVSPAPDKAFSRWLDLFRWVAALAVVFAHASNRFLVHIYDAGVTYRSHLWQGFAFTAGFAHQAVMIFFVLSGYLVGGGLWREAQRNQSVNLTSYFVKRVSRLCIVLYPALLAIALFNLLGIVVFHGVANGIYPGNIFESMRPSTLACNAVYLQTAVCKNYGGDGALWSLYNEFWYYLVWPLMLLGLLVQTTWKRILFLAVAAALLTSLTLLQFEASAIGPYMLIWILGVLVATMRRPLIRSTAMSATLFALGLLAVRLAVRRTFEEAHPVGMFAVDLLVSALFTNLLITMKHNRTLRSPWGRDWNAHLAAFSFSLYCIHIPLLNLYGAVVKRYTGTGWLMIPDRLWKWGLIAGGIVLAVTVAYLFSLVTERHTARLRNFLMSIVEAAGFSRPLALKPWQSSPILGDKSGSAET